MNKELNKKNAKALFEKNSSLKELYFTYDGQAFTSVEPAKTHQRELTGKIDGLHLVKNANYVETSVAVIEDVVEAGDADTEEQEDTEGKKQ